MTTSVKGSIAGVIAAVPTPVDDALVPDLGSFAALCTWLMESGCDGLNVCGTTGEATSFSREQRMMVMGAAVKAVSPTRMLAGTGAASVQDAVALTQHAAALGFSGALVLPPFYYKDVREDGLLHYFEAIMGATAAQPIDLYLYNFPILSGIRYDVPLVRRLRQAFGSRIRGLKDSSGDMPYARELSTIGPDFAVFPSNEATLLDARAGVFAGCISGSANINADLCRAAFHQGDERALQAAIELRQLVTGRDLIANLKVILAHRLKSPGIARVLPPLTGLAADAQDALLARYRELRSVPA